MKYRAVLTPTYISEYNEPKTILISLLAQQAD